MMASDNSTDTHTTVDDEFDYEPIDFRLPFESSPTKSHLHLYECISPRESHKHHHHQHIMYSSMHEMQSLGSYYPSPIVRRQDPYAKLIDEAPHCTSNDTCSDVQQSGEPMKCYSGYPLHNHTSESLPSPPKLLSQPRAGLAVPGPGDMDQRYYHVNQDVRFFPSYKASDRRSANAHATPFHQHKYAHPTPPLSQMAVGVSSSSRSPPSSATKSSFIYPTSEMMHGIWNAQPPGIPPRSTPQESNMPWSRGQNEIEGSSSSMSPSYHQVNDAAMRSHPSIKSFDCNAAIHSPSQESKLNPITALVATYRSNDVLCGRGGATNSHTGNRKFRKIVASHRERYLRAKKRDKPAYAQHVLELVRNQSRSKPCRFLKKDPNSDMWYDIGDEKAREKVAQALREGAAQLRRERKRTKHASSVPRGSPDEFTSNKKQKRAIVEIEMLKGATSKDEHGHLDTQPECDRCEQNPKGIFSDPSTMVVSERRDDSEGALLSAPPLSCREGSEELSIPSELSEEERSLYLTTFLPPRSQLHKGPRSGKQMIIRVR